MASHWPWNDVALEGNQEKIKLLDDDGRRNR